MKMRFFLRYASSYTVMLNRAFRSVTRNNFFLVSERIALPNRFGEKVRSARRDTFPARRLAVVCTHNSDILSPVSHDPREAAYNTENVGQLQAR